MADSCSQYVSTDDLKAAKQSILHIEHVAKSEDAAGNNVLTVTDTIRGENVTNLTLDGLTEEYLTAIRDLGFHPVGNFQGGATLDSVNDIIQDTSTGVWYRWDNTATLPKIVPAGSTPASTGGTGSGKWLAVDVNDVLRRQLAEIDGATVIGAEFTDGSKTTVQGFLDANDSASYRDRCMTKLMQVDYAIHNKGTVIALSLGDSMTAGYDQTSTDSVPPAGEDWARHATTTYPPRFAGYLQEQSGATITSVVRAYSGFTAQEAYNKPEWQSNPHADIVFIMYGINDAQNTTIDLYMEYMEKLVRRYIDWGHAVCVMMPSCGGFGMRVPLAQQYAQRIKNLATLYGCAYFNGNEVQYNRYYPAVQSDIVHFNSNGYARFADALASMCLAGGLRPSYRPVSSELTVWPTIISDQVGYHNAGRELDTSRYPNFAYTLQGISGGFVGNQFTVVAYSFYLDAEAAEIDIVGSWTESSKIRVIAEQKTSSQAGAIVNYYIAQEQSSNRADQVTQFGDAFVRNYASAKTGTPKHLGLLSGRGWKTITFFSPQDGSGGNDAILSQLNIRPIPRYLASRQSPGSIRRGVEEVVMCSVPARDMIPTSGIPAPVVLNSVVVPLPFDLNPIAWDSASEYFDCGFAKLIISGSQTGIGSFYYEAILQKISTGNGLNVGVLHSVGTIPSVTATVGVKGEKVVVAAGSVGTNMPVESIFALGDDSSFTPGYTGNKYGLFLKLDFTWTGTAPTGYYNIALQSFARGLGGASSLVSA